VVVVVKLDEDCSAAVGRLIVDEVLGAPEESSPESLHAANVLRELREPRE
jgi:hypothetical protein